MFICLIFDLGKTFVQAETLKKSWSLKVPLKNAIKSVTFSNTKISFSKSILYSRLKYFWAIWSQHEKTSKEINVFRWTQIMFGNLETCFETLGHKKQSDWYGYYSHCFVASSLWGYITFSSALYKIWWEPRWNLQMKLILNCLKSKQPACQL